jgi:hypothetical protein
VLGKRRGGGVDGARRSTRGVRSWLKEGEGRKRRKGKERKGRKEKRKKEGKEKEKKKRK